MHPAKLEQLCRYWIRRYSPVLLEDYLEQFPTVRTPKPPMAVVFDDGYSDFAEFGWPILQKYGIPASMYVVTDSVDTGTPIWTLELDALLKEMPLNVVFLENETWLDGETWKFSNESERQRQGAKLKHKLKTVSSEIREIVLSKLKTFSNHKTPQNLYLNWDQLMVLGQQGVRIGSHTKSHPPLATLSLDAQKAELSVSKERIERMLGISPQTISYPVGSYNQDTLQLAPQAGYRFGLAVEHRSFNPRTANWFAIPRLELYNEPHWKSVLRFQGVISGIKSLLKK